jgi:hypothetical protein
LGDSRYGSAVKGISKLPCPEGRSSLDIPPKITTNKNKREEIPGKKDSSTVGFTSLRSILSRAKNNDIITLMDIK